MRNWVSGIKSTCDSPDRVVDSLLSKFTSQRLKYMKEVGMANAKKAGQMMIDFTHEHVAATAAVGQWNWPDDYKKKVIELLQSLRQRHRDILTHILIEERGIPEPKWTLTESTGAFDKVEAQFAKGIPDMVSKFKKRFGKCSRI